MVGVPEKNARCAYRVVGHKSEVALQGHQRRCSTKMERVVGQVFVTRRLKSSECWLLRTVNIGESCQIV